jgi:nitrogen regulatory protein PII
VVNTGNASKVLKYAKNYGIKGGTISIGWGTVNDRVLKFLALNEVQREIVTMVVESELASEAIRGISEYMAFEKPHHGIAFSYSVSDFIGSKNILDKASENTERSNTMHNIIYAIVDKGKGEDVITAAEKVGSKGGTIINARGAGVHEVQKFFSIEIEPEKEEVFIIAKSELKDKIVESIKTDLKIDEPGNGILFVLDVDEVYGV